jgi:hypothetical protein
MLIKIRRDMIAQLGAKGKKKVTRAAFFGSG